MVLFRFTALLAATTFTLCVLATSRSQGSSASLSTPDVHPHLSGDSSTHHTIEEDDVDSNASNDPARTPAGTSSSDRYSENHEVNDSQEPSLSSDSVFSDFSDVSSRHQFSKGGRESLSDTSVNRHGRQSPEPALAGESDRSNLFDEVSSPPPKPKILSNERQSLEGGRAGPSDIPPDRQALKATGSKRPVQDGALGSRPRPAIHPKSNSSSGNKPIPSPKPFDRPFRRAFMGSNTPSKGRAPRQGHGAALYGSERRFEIPQGE